jgi:hypothetical protein
MLTLAVGMLVVAYLLIYSAFTHQSPMAEIRAAFGRGRSH